jgi:hypothetical protein
MDPPPVKRRFTSAVSRWIVPVVWAAVILTLGTSLFSMVRTSAMFDPLIARMIPGISAEAMFQIQVFVRRCTHVLEYGILFLVLNLGPLRGRPLAAFLVCGVTPFRWTVLGCGTKSPADDSFRS